MKYINLKQKEICNIIDGYYGIRRDVRTVNAKKHFARLTAACLIVTTLFGGAASADSVTVTTDRLNMRAEDSASSKAVGVIEKGDELSFVSESGDWYQVKNGGKTGFVMKDYVKLDQSRIAEDVSLNTEPYSGKAEATDRVNIRELPMTKAKIVKVVPKEGQVELIGKCGVWYQVSYSGKTGYIMAKYLTVEQETETVPGNPADGETLYAAAKTGRATERVNLRESASADADIVRVLSKNAELTILGENGVWYKVTSGSKTGYVSRAYVQLTETGAAEETVQLYAQPVSGKATERVNMRKSPSTGAGIAKVLDEDDSVSVLGETGNWYKVSAGSKEGYVVKSYIALTGTGGSIGNEDAVVPDGLVSYPAARSGSVTERVNLREEASTGADIVKVLEKGASVSVLGENGSFYQVKYGESIGYIAKSYVQLGESNAPQQPENDQQTGVTGETLYAEARTAQTTVKVNMRREPEGDVLFVLPQNTKISLIGEVGGWYKVTYSTSVGYITKSYVTEEVTAPGQPENGGATQAPEINGNGTTGYVTGASVNMRKGPSTSYGVIKVLYAGDEVTFYQEIDGWYQIKAGSDTGYISAKYISTKKPESAPSNPGGNTDYENVAGKVQMADWWTSNIQKTFKVGVIAQVTDVDTGLTWLVKRSGGSNHADVQPLTAADTAKMKQAYNGKWSWDRHAIWVTINGVSYAASMNGMPHGSGSIKDNNFDGHHCIHFLNSRTHTGNRWDTAHQAAVQKAYKAGQ